MKQIETVEEYNAERMSLIRDHRKDGGRLREASLRMYFDQQGAAIALRSDLIRKPTGEEIVNAVVLADALSEAYPLPDGRTQFIWSSNANEQIEAALDEIMSKNPDGGDCNECITKAK